MVILLGLLALSFFDLDVSMGISKKVSVVITVAVVAWMTYLDYSGGGKTSEKKSNN